MSGRGKRLTAEEKRLWGSVARTVRPLPGRFPEIEEPASAEQNPAAKPPTHHVAISKAPEPAPGLSRAMLETLKRQFAEGPAQQRPTLPGSMASGSGHPTIEKPVHRKLARGRLPIDARLDLHGLDQEQAHGMLHAFLTRAQAEGLRHVLVITGKGASMGSEGALKRAVPQWLAKPGFLGLISGWEWAARGHGGEGALYIRLKKTGTDR
jgi:DNA-nicking Smr family endonuclease